MKGNSKVIEKLNSLLAEELTAINQYIVHTEMCENWGYKHLEEVAKKRSMGEMKHAEKLIARIIFLEGIPIVSNLNKIHIGADVPKQLSNDWASEDNAVKSYNEGIRLAVEMGDNGSRELMESILKEEEEHINEIEAQLDQLKQMGESSFLSEQIG